MSASPDSPMILHGYTIQPVANAKGKTAYYTAYKNGRPTLANKCLDELRELIDKLHRAGLTYG